MMFPYRGIKVHTKKKRTVLYLKQCSRKLYNVKRFNEGLHLECYFINYLRKFVKLVKINQTKKQK